MWCVRLARTMVLNPSTSTKASTQHPRAPARIGIALYCDVRVSECLHACFGDSLILLTQTSTHPDGSHNLIAALQRNTPREDHHAAVIRDMDSEKLIAGLTQFGQSFG